MHNELDSLVQLRIVSCLSCVRTDGLLLESGRRAPREQTDRTDRQNRQMGSCPWSSEVFQFVVHWCSLVPKDPCVPRTRVVVHTSLWFNQLCLLHSLSQLFQLKVSQFCLSSQRPALHFIYLFNHSLFSIYSLVFVILDLTCPCFSWSLKYTVRLLFEILLFFWSIYCHTFHSYYWFFKFHNLWYVDSIFISFKIFLFLG